MAHKPRDYKAEYARRKTRGLARGLSLAQARGHPRAGETFASGKPSTPARTDALEAGLKQLRSGMPLKHAAKEAGVPEEKFRRYVKGNRLAAYAGRQWVMSDQRARRVPILRAVINSQSPFRTSTAQAMSAPTSTRSAAS